MIRLCDIFKKGNIGLNMEGSKVEINFFPNNELKFGTMKHFEHIIPFQKMALAFVNKLESRKRLRFIFDRTSNE